jgi:hypothetical protein
MRPGSGCGTEVGQIKAPATEVLVTGAERWAARTGWSLAEV